MSTSHAPNSGLKRASNAQNGPFADITNLHNSHADLHGKRRKTLSSLSSSSSSSSKQFPALPSTTTLKTSSPATPAISIRQRVKLSKEQQDALRLVLAGHSIFLTGSAGTGKSVLLREIIRSLKDERGGDAVTVTASTGIAACNIGGCTLHSFGAFGLGTATVENCVKIIKSKPDSLRSWMSTHCLVIDEISMLDATYFDKFVHVARALNAKRKREPLFTGGIQFVLAGDFFQLPPVCKKGEVRTFAFDAKTWPEVVTSIVQLKQVYRQSDTVFSSHLNDVRHGTISQSCAQFFHSLHRPLDSSDGILPTQLFPLRAQVDKANQDRMSKLRGISFVYHSVDGGRHRDRLDGLLATDRLELKVGCQVMLIKNRSDTLVNGVVGNVVGFGTRDSDRDAGDLIEGSANDTASSIVESCMTARRYPLVKFTIHDKLRNRDDFETLLVVPEKFTVHGELGSVVAHRTQVPLILAWAISIHKSQGQSIRKVRVDLGHAFEKGQAYVALSRATSADGLQVVNFKRDKVMAHARVVEWSAARLEDETELDDWPIDDSQLDSDDWRTFEETARKKANPELVSPSEASSLPDQLRSDASTSHAPTNDTYFVSPPEAASLPDQPQSHASTSNPPTNSAYFKGLTFYIHSSVHDARAVTELVGQAGGNVVKQPNRANIVLCKQLSPIQMASLKGETSLKTSRKLPPAIVNAEYVRACHEKRRRLSTVTWDASGSIASSFGENVSPPVLVPQSNPW